MPDQVQGAEGPRARLHRVERAIVGPPDAAESLGDMVRLAQQGDEAAWRHLHLRFTHLLRSIAAGHRLYGADAADAVQATWSKCFESIATLREPEAFAGWLSVICRHEAIRVVKARIRCTPVDCESDALAREFATSEDPTGREALTALPENRAPALLHVLFDDLSERDRRLMWALTAEGASYQRVAVLCDMPVGSIGPTRQRIIRRLRRRARALELDLAA